MFKGMIRSKNRFFFLFHFSNVQHFTNKFFKGFVEIRKIPDVIGICVAANAWATTGHSAPM